MKMFLLIWLLAITGCERYHDTPPAPAPGSKDQGDFDLGEIDDELDSNDDKPQKDAPGTVGDPQSPNDEDPDHGDQTPGHPNPEPGTGNSGAGNSGNNGGDDGDQSTTNPQAFSVAGMLYNLGYNITYANVLAYTQQLREFKGAFTDYCAHPTPEAAPLAALQHEWRLLSDHWQRLELAQFGPLAADNHRIRNQIYSRHLAAQPSFVASEALKAQRPNYQFKGRLNTVGLDAFEAALFSSQMTAVCDRFTRVPSQWSRLDTTSQHQAMCQYLSLAMKDLEANSVELLKAWSPSSGDYVTELVAGSAPQHHAAVNQITDALFYLESDTKDGKLGVLVGKKTDICTGPLCQCYVEHRYAHNSLTALETNLKTFRAYVSGTPQQNIKSQKQEYLGMGLAQFLEDQNQPQLANQLKGTIDRALDHLQQIEFASLYELAVDFDGSTCDLTQAPADQHQLCEVYSDFKAVTDLFKNDVMQALKLNVPAKSAGDGD